MGDPRGGSGTGRQLSRGWSAGLPVVGPDSVPCWNNPDFPLPPPIHSQFIPSVLTPAASLSLKSSSHRPVMYL